ncbi:DUF7322 domain-containing protein [Natronorubrum texcoconense]|uniref:DUF7322 domain-containing protein n=1 Tax=Natronorubrum texcoconense TaxID=1095776 RepID=A0A1G9AI03_9EURY|nr:hypothetical protein [Natronorubrum texcoconense]SDK26454.1 hypothetical protein SAMN04515672_2732 [Natronorubrum texcoconense]
MGLDRSEHEPDEYDPEEEFRDPESDSLTIPQVPTENAGSDLRSDLKSEFEEDAIPEPEFSAAETDVDGETLKNFWALVLVINAAVLAYALAALFLVFEGATTYAGYLFAAGLVLTGFGIQRYRTVRRDIESDSSTTDPAGDSAEGSSRDDRTDEATASGRETDTTGASDDDQTGKAVDDD